MKFKHAKKFCHGFAVIDQFGKILRHTFVKRKGHVMSGHMAWAKIDGKNREDFTKDGFKEYIKRNLEKGYKVVPVNMIPLLEDGNITIGENLLYELLVRAYNSGSINGFDGEIRAEVLSKILQMAKEGIKYESDLAELEPEEEEAKL